MRMTPTNKAWSLSGFGQTGLARIHICGEDMLPSIEINFDLYGGFDFSWADMRIILTSRHTHIWPSMWDSGALRMLSMIKYSSDEPAALEHERLNGALPKRDEADFKRYFRPDLMNKPSLVETPVKKKAKSSVLSLESYHSPEAMTPEPKPTEALVFTECQDCGAELEYDDIPFDAFFLYGLCVYGRKRRGNTSTTRLLEAPSPPSPPSPERRAPSYER
ncbi:hypothetical protein T492DRAFT_1119050 [Pavlovales sp. CCMP2436]|nr:hypothetical protein T492DRAFT_1119050 [Pavlovales sp. CCMP2436]